MTAVVGKAWGWVRSWGGKPSQQPAQATIIAEEKKPCPKGGWTSWIWFGWSRKSDPIGSPVEEFWEAPDKIQPLEVEELKAGKQETEVQPRWWNKLLPTYYIYWPKKESAVLQRRANGQECDIYGTPPPSPTPPITSPFRLFVSSWKLEVLPEHYDICFNFLRHLFDLFTVGFLWTVSTPSKIILEILGIQGALRLWFHGMAMFLVSTIGMAGLLGLIQEYLPQFTFIYGIIQALVISVSVKQSGLDGDTEEEQLQKKKEEELKEKAEVKKDTTEHKAGVKTVSSKEKLKKIS